MPLLSTSESGPRGNCPVFGSDQHDWLPCERENSILWLQHAAENRRLFEGAEFYEAWATEGRTGLHYCVTKKPELGCP